jgi:hypothetical protein
MPEQNMSIEVLQKWFEEYSTPLFIILYFIIFMVFIIFFGNKLTNLIWNIKPEEEKKN